MENTYQEINLVDLMKKAIKFWWLIVLFTIAGAVMANYYTLHRVVPIYQADTTLFIGKEIESTSTNVSEDIRLGTALIMDYKQLVKTDQVLDQTITELGLNMSPSSLKGRISVSSVEGSRFIYLSVKDANPERAKVIADKLSDVLKEKAEKFVQVKNVNVVDYAKIPRYAISPNVRLNTMVGGLVGLMLAGFFVLAYTVLLNKVEREEQIEKATGLTIIGVIPKFKGGI